MLTNHKHKVSCTYSFTKFYYQKTLDTFENVFKFIFIWTFIGLLFKQILEMHWKVNSGYADENWTAKTDLDIRKCVNAFLRCNGS